jgi:hypothetical protein
MNFKIWLERYGEWNANNVIVVDVQPEYKDHIPFDIYRFSQFLKSMLDKNRKILYFYNGQEIGSQDTPEAIIEWLVDYDEDFYYELRNQVVWIDKGYGFFRSWMDSGMDEADIIKIIRYMVMNRIYDSRDIENLDELVDDYPEYDPIYIPYSISLPLLKQFAGAFLCGGAETACLAEVRLLMNAFNIPYRLVKEFVY